MSNKGKGSQKPNNKSTQNPVNKPNKPRNQPNDKGTNNPSNKKLIEEQQKAVAEEQLKQLQEKIDENEREKKRLGTPIESSHTLIKTWNNDLKKVPDISNHWLFPNGFLPFLPQNNGLSMDGDESIQIMNQDVSKLLKAKFHVFWSHVLLDKSLRTFLDTYLRFKRRPYEDEPSDSNLTTQDLLFRRVFSLILRMSTHEETSSTFMDKKYFKSQMNELKIWNLSSLMDVCVLYGCSVPKLLPQICQRIVENVQEIGDELKVAPNQILSSIQHISKQVESGCPHDKMIEFQRYLLDIFATLSSFLTICSDASISFQNANFLQAMPAIYDVTITHIEKSNLEASKDPVQVASIHRSIGMIRESMLSIANAIFTSCFFDRFHEQVALHFKLPIAEKLQEVLDFLPTQIREDSKVNFLRDFATKYSLQSKLDQIRQMNFSLKLDYVMGMLDEICGKFQSKRPVSQNSGNQGKKISAEQMSLISQVKDLFPEYGEGFIDALLRSLGNTPSRAIDAILEGNFPPQILKLDKNLALSSQSSQNEPEVSQNFPKKDAQPRRSIFDGDEFDIMSGKTVDMTRVYVRGSNQKEIAARAALEDKSEIRQMKDRYMEYAYEDEYDDSYDNYAGNFELSSENVQDENIAKKEKAGTQNTKSNTRKDHNKKEDKKVADKKPSSKEEKENSEEEEEEGESDEDVQDESSQVPKALPGVGRGGAVPKAADGNPAGRGRGRGRGYRGKSHNRKDQSIKKRGITG